MKRQGLIGLVSVRQRAASVCWRRLSINTPSSCACRRLAARNWRNPVAVAKSDSAARGRHHGGKGFLLPLVEAFGVDIQGACSGLGRAAFIGQA